MFRGGGRGQPDVPADKSTHIRGTHTHMHVQAHPSDKRDTNTHSRPLQAPRGPLICLSWGTWVMCGSRLGLNKRRNPDATLTWAVWGCSHGSLSRGLMDGAS